MANDHLFDTVLADDKTDTLEFTSMRLHELALQRWINTSFFVKDGYPIPMVFATPRDAHAEFIRLWKMDNNPYQYLLNLKDSTGKAVYQPYPSNVIYPLIGVTRLNWALRVNQSYGYHMNRRAYWPTVQGTLNGNGTVSRNDMAWAASVSMPVGWDFRFQIDHYCNTPQSQSIFVNRVMRTLRFSGGSAQAFIPVKYPFPHRTQMIRIYMESGIENVSNDAVDDANQEIRTSFNVVIEGYWMDYLTKINPAMWEVALAKEGVAVSPDLIDKYFDLHDIYVGVDDVRVGQNNPAVDSRGHLPPLPAT